MIKLRLDSVCQKWHIGSWFHNNIESSKHLLLSDGRGREFKGEADEMVEFIRCPSVTNKFRYLVFLEKMGMG